MARKEEKKISVGANTADSKLCHGNKKKKKKKTDIFQKVYVVMRREVSLRRAFFICRVKVLRSDRGDAKRTRETRAAAHTKWQLFFNPSVVFFFF